MMPKPESNTMSQHEEREIVYVERDAGSVKPILFGALLGLAVGLLFAPQSGDETRRQLRRRLRKVRALAEEKVGELSEKISGEWKKPAGREDRGDDVRSDLERRLAEARARRRAPTPADEDDDEEPVA
jgi:gas vesicle protein